MSNKANAKETKSVKIWFGISAVLFFIAGFFWFNIGSVASDAHKGLYPVLASFFSLLFCLVMYFKVIKRSNTGGETKLK